jgi:hypothetical protein
MRRNFSRILGSILFILAASAAAIWLADFAHDHLGIARHVIRADAILCAIGLGGLLMLALYSDQFGKRK